MRPTIAPSITPARPMCVTESITLWVVRAFSRRVTFADSTEYGPTVASGRIRQ